MATKGWIPRDRPQTTPPTKQPTATTVEPKSTKTVWWQQHAYTNANALQYANWTANPADAHATTIHGEPPDGTAAVWWLDDAGIPNGDNGRTAFFLTVRGGIFV